MARGAALEGGPGRPAPCAGVTRAARIAQPPTTRCGPRALPGRIRTISRVARENAPSDRRPGGPPRRPRGLTVHLDGARDLARCPAALDLPPATLTEGVDYGAGSAQQRTGRTHGLPAVRLEGRHGPRPGACEDAGGRGPPGRHDGCCGPGGPGLSCRESPRTMRRTRRSRRGSARFRHPAPIRNQHPCWPLCPMRRPLWRPLKGLAFGPCPWDRPSASFPTAT